MNVESVLDLSDLLLIQLATLQKVGIPFQSNDLNVRKLLTPLFKPCISMSIFRLYPEFATHDHCLWSDYIAISGAFILYEISMECAQEYPHPQRSSKSCQRMRPMYGIRWLCS